MDITKFREAAVSATGGVLLFADFTARSEELMSGGGFDEDLVQRYNDAWLEMEIVNALALDEWDLDGRPREWDEKWALKYRSDAEDTIRDVLEVLDSR